MRGTILILSVFTFLGLNGCSGTSTRESIFTSGSNKFPQTMEMEYANPFKMKIESCSWTSSINKLEDVQNSDLKIMQKAQDDFLVVNLVLTNYGDRPLNPKEPPIFELVAANGNIFGSQQSPNSLLQQIVMNGNVNPGRSLKAREVFDVPRGEYQLRVFHGKHLGGWSYGKNDLAWVWELSPNDGH